MTPETRRALRLAALVLIAAFSVLFFFQTKDPMILIFGIIAGALAFLVLGGSRAPMGGGAGGIRVRCPHCRALNLEDAKFCAQCGRAM